MSFNYLGLYFDLQFPVINELDFDTQIGEKR